MLPNPPPMLDPLDRKLYTLLSLRELGGCTHLQLLSFLVENDVMSDFDLSLALHELVDEGGASVIGSKDKSVFSITEAGLETLSFFLNRLPHSKVEQLRQNAPAWRERQENERMCPAEVIRLENGGCVARLSLLDGDGTLMTLEIPSPDRHTARQLAAVWPRHAAELYQTIIQTLGEALP